MNPSDIAKQISENIHDKNGCISEDLYGRRVTPGDAPIDQLIAFVEQQYIEWDLNDKRFKHAVVKFLGKVPTTIGAWMMLFSKSVQRDDLKRLLINKLSGIQQQIGIPVGDGPFDIYFKNGKVISVDAVYKSNSNSDLYYAAQNPGNQPPRHCTGNDHIDRPADLGMVTHVPRPRPGQNPAYTSTRRMWIWYFQNVFTFNKWNVIRVVSMRQTQ